MSLLYQNIAKVLHPTVIISGASMLVHRHLSSLRRYQSMRTSSWIKIVAHSMRHSSPYEICHDLKSIDRHNCVNLPVLPPFQEQLQLRVLLTCLPMMMALE